jgi:hypothetical protein
MLGAPFSPKESEEGWRAMCSGRPLVLYGAGRACRRALPLLLGMGARPQEIWDRSAGEGQSICGLPVKRARERREWAEEPLVCVTIADSVASAGARADLIGMGYRDVLPAQALEGILLYKTCERYFPDLLEGKAP